MEVKDNPVQAISEGEVDGFVLDGRSAVKLDKGITTMNWPGTGVLGQLRGSTAKREVLP